MHTTINWLSMTRVVVCFHQDDGSTRAIACEIDPAEDTLSQFNSIMSALYAGLIDPLKREISRCKRRLGLAERYIAKNHPLPQDKQNHYLKVIVDAKLRIDALLQAKNTEMIKISSIYTVIPPKKIQYLRALRRRDRAVEELEQANRLLESYGDCNQEDWQTIKSRL